MSVLLTALIVSFLALTLVLLLLHFVSYAKAKAFFDWYVAALGVQGKGKSYLTEEAHNRFFANLPITAGVFGTCGGTLALFKQKLIHLLIDTLSEWRGIRKSFLDQFHGGVETALEIGAVFIVFAFGVFLRVWHLGRAVRYDEARTYVEFASRPLVVGLSNYEAPNNHLLNTLLVHFSTRLFGNTTFGLRLPALVAGSLVIVASWFVTRELYGRLAGILAAGCIAALPTFIEFSVNARGYALQWLFILAMMWFGILLPVNPSLRIGWLGFVLAGVAGTYSIPTTLIAVVGILGWMLASTLTDGSASKLKDLTRKAGLAGLAIVLLSAVLYVPPLLDRGSEALAAKELVTWQQSDFTAGLKRTSECAWIYWSEGVPREVLWILFGGLVIALVFHRRIRKHSVSLTIALWLSAVIFAWGHHVFGYPRVWSYLLLSTVITACAGLALLQSSLLRRSGITQVAVASAASVALAVVVGVGVIKQRALFTSTETRTITDADQIVDFLSAVLRPGDALSANSIVNYELLRRNPNLYSSLAQPQEALRVVAVVAKRNGADVCRSEEVVSLLAAQDTAGIASLALDVDLNAYATPHVWAKFLSSTVYSLDRRDGGRGVRDPHPQN